MYMLRFLQKVYFESPVLFSENMDRYQSKRICRRPSTRGFDPMDRHLSSAGIECDQAGRSKS